MTTTALGIALLCLFGAGFLILRLIRRIHDRIEFLEHVQRRALEECKSRHPSTGRHYR